VKFGKVLGSVVCTKKDANLEGVKLLVIQPLTQKLEPRGMAYIAADAVGQAGIGQIVSIVFSADATQAFPQERIPVDASIVGLVDQQTLADLTKGGANHLS
jgi:ethanolamine utilization protein EutN